ncbi:MAG: hypothetical protein A2Y03_04075 [Omnitrophica WOR_2 bacterium GWF2_38_59]|nr:MAG: hypothetical protein A2Y06_06785 [Omnitrophica WOR_2 bacterium GWA2_37_7]OGX25558.1 MAG: hypothetical protein A2Y03_04075 [Omnitrophica WOR_2 bacterium GWF2_38_59]OGX50177.1 MAG: hypothetical protein A2243_08555 [Omnitrophica WOR_2 bacterium RIFOXYA2_FULL_38_17]OGX52803.1 MAG: hypothetical protein A2267_07580 [Omnitrophica WOR_2 bacterium RIFOXYA12_FULL_38_10]OGX57455.1 MAG: hypothetical protein A2306_03025 [Omnitrophica WOR_2 bacterium RIFOXYB2_FULL_38_16]OGX57491.1 MAG: hypothetical 
MEVYDAIMTRRSIRKFSDKPVAKKLLKMLLEAAMNAPSASDARPWHFVLVDDKAKLNLLAKDIDEDNNLFKEAQAAILICGNESLEKFKGFWPQDCSCAAQNLQLAAHGLGLGTVWIAIYSIPSRIEGCRKILGVPGNLEPFAIFPIGYPSEFLEPEYRYDKSMIQNNGW